MTEKKNELTMEDNRRIVARLNKIEEQIAAIEALIGDCDFDSGTPKRLPASFATFLDQRCAHAPSLRAASISLYQAYKDWVENHHRNSGEAPVSHKAFAALMSDCGFRKTKTRTGVIYDSIGLRADD